MEMVFWMIVFDFFLIGSIKCEFWIFFAFPSHGKLYELFEWKFF